MPPGPPILLNNNDDSDSDSNNNDILDLFNADPAIHEAQFEASASPPGNPHVHLHQLHQLILLQELSQCPKCDRHPTKHKAEADTGAKITKTGLSLYFAKVTKISPSLHMTYITSFAPPQVPTFVKEALNESPQSQQ